MKETAIGILKALLDMKKYMREYGSGRYPVGL